MDNRTIVRSNDCSIVRLPIYIPKLRSYVAAIYKREEPLSAAPRRYRIQHRHLRADASGDRLKEAAVRLERFRVALCDRLLHVLLDGRRDQFHAADKNAGDLRGLGLDAKRQE